MKLLLMILLTSGVGIGVGWTLSYSEHGGVTHTFGPGIEITDGAPSEPTEPRPVMTLIDGTVHHFGTMQRGSFGECRFRIRNDGDAVLTLKVLKASCKCTRAEILQPSLAPGETTELQLEWQAILKGNDPSFRQEAPVVSNDPECLRTMFAIEGELFYAIEASRSRISLGNISAKETYTSDVEIYCNTESDFAITDISQQSESLAAYVDCEVKPMPAKTLAKRDGAKAGAVVSLTVKPGLPPGRFKQEVIVKTNLQGAEVPLTVEANVVSDITVVGEGYSLATNVLKLGTVDSSVGHEAKLLLLVKGEHHATTEFKVASTDPSAQLEVQIGERRSLKNAEISQFPLRVRVPAGVEPIERRGTDQGSVGVIALETTHPRLKSLQIWVQFAVE